MITTKDIIQKHLSDEINEIILKGKGAVNNACFIETKSGSKYIVKQEREDKEFQPQNDLVTEANVIKQLTSLSLSFPIPKVTFISESPKMYGYEYIEGEILRGLWSSLSEDEKINICKSLGYFHAEIGKKFSKDMAESIGITIDPSTGLHPEVLRDYGLILENPNVPDSFKNLSRKAKEIFDTTETDVLFQFLHNDAHHENILIKDKKISGIIDFGNAEYGEIAKEFSRYIRDFPAHFQHIVSAYEEKSDKKLSYKRLVTNSLLSGLIDNVEDYLKGGESRIKAETAIATYQELIDKDVYIPKTLDKSIKRKYSLSDYDPSWIEQFLLIKSFLVDVFGDKALKIEHVGSTSIQGMKAKPLIDVLITVEKIEPFLKQKEAMVKAGYEWGENYIQPNTLIFFKVGYEGEKLQNVHVCEDGSPKAIQFVIMRDYLRTHPEKVKAYSDLKKKNTELYPNDYPAYRTAKKPFLDELEKDAEEWFKNTSINS